MARLRLSPLLQISIYRYFTLMIDLCCPGHDDSAAEKEVTMPIANRSIKKVRFITLCAMCIILCSCATMFSPGEDEITIKSEPEGADVYDGANLIGKTPLTYSFVRDTFERKDLTLKMKGRKSYDLRLERTMEKTAIWNFAFFITTGGATSWGIDALSGHLIRYSPNSYLIDLNNTDASTGKKDLAHGNRLRFVMLNQDNLKKDIATGRGEYLRAYYDMRPLQNYHDGYQGFLRHVSSQARFLLAVTDPQEFYHEFEGRTGVFPGANSGETRE
jgi:hypothetical protein